MYEYLKELFGSNNDGTPVALTFDQLVEKLGSSDSIRLVNLSDGGYVPEEKLSTKETELAGLREQLDAANREIQSYKDMDIEGIKQSVVDWEKKYNADTAALNQRIADNERAFNEELFLRSYKYSSKAAAEGIRAEFAKRKFTYENGVFLGAKEFMDNLMADDDYKAAFVIDAPAEPHAPEAPKPQFSSSAPQQPDRKPKPRLVDLMRRKNENPNAEIIFD